MSRLAPFSAASVIGDVAAAARAALDHLADERGLSAGELAQSAAFEALEAAAREAASGSFSMYRAGGDRTEPVRKAVERCGEATAGAGAMPLVELLGMRNAVPNDWARLPVSLDTILWLGVTRFADELSLVPASGLSSARRQEQLAAIRDLQAALGRVIRLALQASPSEQDRKRTTDRADARFTRAANAIRDDLPAIRVEIAALRKRR